MKKNLFNYLKNNEIINLYIIKLYFDFFSNFMIEFQSPKKSV